MTEQTEKMRQTFLESAVRVVARDGLERTTTKSIAAEAELNEAYIYRCFKSKDDLLRAALHMEDIGFARMLHETLPIMRFPGMSWKERAFVLWDKSWAFILQNEADCRFYLRYYYSASCRRDAYAEHLACFHALIDRTRLTFRSGTETDMLIHQIFDTMLAFATRVMGGELEQCEKNTRWIFEQIYSFVAPHVRPEILAGKV